MWNYIQGIDTVGKSFYTDLLAIYVFLSAWIRWQGWWQWCVVELSGTNFQHVLLQWVKKSTNIYFSLIDVCFFERKRSCNFKRFLGENDKTQNILFYSVHFIMVHLLTQHNMQGSRLKWIFLYTFLFFHLRIRV